MKFAPTLRKLVVARLALGAYRTFRAPALARRSRNRKLLAVGGVLASAALAWLIFDRLYTAPQLESPSLRPAPPSRKKLRAIERREAAERAHLEAERAPRTARVHVVVGQPDELAVKLADVVKH